MGDLRQSSEAAVNRRHLTDALSRARLGQGRLPQEEHDGGQNGSHADDSNLKDVHGEAEEEVGKSRLLENLEDSGDQVRRMFLLWRIYFLGKVVVRPGVSWE